MNYLIIIVFLLNVYPIISDELENDINIYGTFLGNSAVLLELDLEYKILNTSILGIGSNTYLKCGSSMFGAYDLVLAYSNPIIGIVQYFGNKEGIDIGINYFERYHRSFFDKSLPRAQRTPDKDDYTAIGFEIGYRCYSEHTIYRFTYTPAYILDSNFEEGILTHYIGFSMGYSF